MWRFHRMGRWRQLAARTGVSNAPPGALVLLCLMGLCCTVPLANDLEETAANQLAASLARSGIAAEKKRDPEHEGRFVVDVSRADSSFALAVLAAEELPRRLDPGLRDSLDQRSLIPTQDEEHARWLLGTAAELERSLLGLDGIISVRVHLAVPRPSLLGEVPGHPSASVLLKFAAPKSPVSAEEVRDLVAGAVPGLQSTRVEVVSKGVTLPTKQAPTDLVRVGPLTTTRSSLPYLRWLLVAVGTLNASMVALLIALWRRSRRPLGPATSRAGQ